MNHYEEHRPGDLTRYLAENVNGRLIISLRNVSHTMRALYEGKGSQKRILMVLNDTGTITQRELTHRLGIQPGSASEVIAKLERAGLVERTSSEEDRRTADILLTKEGERQALEALEQRQRRHEEMFSALTPEEKAQLLALLEKVSADWQERYGDQKDRHRGGHHGRNFECREDHEGHHCDHDCANCLHPCGRGRNRQA